VIVAVFNILFLIEEILRDFSLHGFFILKVRHQEGKFLS